MPDLPPPTDADDDRCESVHWSLPVQCVLKSSHRENWHEAWHPESGNRLRYRHPGSLTEELHHGEWHSLFLPKPTDPITTADQIRALPVGAIIMSRAGVAFQVGAVGEKTVVTTATIGGTFYWREIDDNVHALLKHAPFRVLYTPGGDRG